MISQFWWYADTDMNFDVMFQIYQMIPYMRDTNIDTDWSDREADVAVSIVSDISFGCGYGL